MTQALPRSPSPENSSLFFIAPEHHSEADLLKLTPGVEVVGLDNPLERNLAASPPEVLFHAHAGESFKFDEFFKRGASQGIGNIFLGEGLYCGDQKLAGLYKNELKRGRGSAGVATILPHQANLIDLNKAACKQPLDANWLQAFHQSFDGRHDNPNIRQLHSMARRNDRKVSLYDIVTLGVMGQRLALKDNPVQSFLMNIGIDGVSVSIRPSVDMGNPHQATVFWRHDRIGDRQTWEKRSQARARIGKLAKVVGGLASVSPQSEDMNLRDVYEQNPALVLRHPKKISRNEGLAIKSQIDAKPILSPAAGGKLLGDLYRDNINPYQLVKELAASSVVADRLLSADVGVWEGYRLHEHTQAVLGQFERFFAQHHEKDDNFKALATIVRTAALLQDMGKPLAVAIEASRRNQDHYNAAAATNILQSMPFRTPVKQMLVDLIGQNIIGSAITGDVRAQETSAQQLASLTRKHADTLKEYPGNSLFQIMYMLYVSDASAYTSSARYRDASTQVMHRCKSSSLDDTFIIGEQASRIKPNARNQQTIMKLINRVNQLNEPYNGSGQ